MKTLTILLSGMLALCLGQNANAQGTLTAKQIVQRASEARQLPGSEAVTTLSIFNSSGDARVRKIAVATKLYDGGKTEKRIYRFVEPADVKGTGVLVFDYTDKNDDMWVFMPALRKTRRIVSSEKSKAFMGSEFSYGDMNVPVLDNYTYKILGEENVDHTICWKIETAPKNDTIAEEEGYQKKFVWIGKSDFVIRKALYLDLDGERLKELTNTKVEKVDEKNNKYRAKIMVMKNLQNGRRSVFTVENIVLNANAEDDYFTTRYLERI